MSELIGDCRLVPCKEQHLHPKTGEPPDYHWRAADGTYEPRWRRKKPMLAPTEVLYSTKEATQILGCCEATIRNMMKDGRLKFTKVKRRIKFRANWLRDAMDTPISR